MVKKIEKFVLSEYTNNLYKKEAGSSIALTRDVADKINELVEAFNSLENYKLEKIHEQDGKISKAIIYMKDNLLHTMDELMQILIDRGVIDNKIAIQVEDLRIRVENLLGSITEGSTTMDSEVIDGRVGYNGTSYSNLGDSIRTQIKDVAHKLDDLKKDLNLFTIDEHKGYLTISSANKPVYSNEDTYKCLVSELITCNPGDKFYYKGNSINAVAGWIFFNKGAVLSHGNVNSHDLTKETITIPEGCTHVMFSSFVDVNSDREFGLEIKYLGSNKASDRVYNRFGEIEKMINYYPYTEQSGYLTANIKYSKDSSIHSKTTGLIPTKYGEKFKYYGIGRGLSVCWVFYDETGINVIGSGNNSSYSATETVVEIPEGCYYVQFSSFDSTSKEVPLQIKYVNEQTIDEKINTTSSINANSILNGKKWVACGDSFTAGDFSNSLTNDYTIKEGKYSGYKKVYPYLIGNRNNMTIINEAVNGSTLANVSGKNPLCLDRLTSIPKDADYITIKIGINDSHNSVAIGSVSDTSDTTFYGAWNKVLDYLSSNLPYAKIGIIVTNGSTSPYVQATINVAKKWGIPYIDLATDEKLPLMLRSNRTDVSDEIKLRRDKSYSVNYELGNTHPNEKAHELESTIIENFLLSI